jgi:hypothetical protein
MNCLIEHFIERTALYPGAVLSTIIDEIAASHENLQSFAIHLPAV